MAFAPIWNPLSKSQKLLVFGISTNKQLNLRNVDIGDDEIVARSATNADSLAEGSILVPSALTSVLYKDWIRTYGWLKIKDSEGNTTNCLYILSPAPMWIWQTKSPYGSLAGVSDGENEGHLYYIDYDDTVRELYLAGGDPLKIDETVKLKKGSALACCLGEKKRRFVAYQISDNRIRVFDTRAQQSLPTLDATINAKEKTPLAVVEFAKDNVRYFNLYYIRINDNSLMRCQRAGEGGWQNVALSEAGNPHASTSLNATWDAKKQRVFVTFFTTDSELTVKEDKW